MTEKRITLERVGLKYGVILGAVNIGYFLLMALFGLEEETWLRIGNFVIMFWFIYLAIRYYKYHNTAGMTYLRGLGTGALTAAAGTTVFAIFLFIYAIFDPEFVASLKNTQPMGEYLNPLIIASVAHFEGVFWGLIFSFILMQRLKTSHFKNPVRK